jgi:hypothetical protein
MSSARTIGAWSSAFRRQGVGNVRALDHFQSADRLKAELHTLKGRA